MLKAGKNIKLRANSIDAMHTIQVAPQIDIHGLILRADKAISKEVIQFLKSKGCNVQQITEDGDKLVRLSGCFSLTEDEVRPFLRKEGEEEKAQDNSNAAVNFQRQLSTQIKNSTRFTLAQLGIKETFTQTVRLYNDDEGQPQGNLNIKSEKKDLVTIETSGISAGLSAYMTSKEGSVTQLDVTHNAGITISIKAGKKHKLTASNFQIHNSEFSFGLLSQINANKDINIQSMEENIIDNSVLFAGDEISISSKNNRILIGCNPNVLWKNAPNKDSLSIDFRFMNKSVEELDSVASSSSSSSSLSHS